MHLLNSALIGLMASSSGWNFGEMLSAVQKTVQSYGKVIIGITGIVMLVAAIVFAAINWLSRGKGQSNWLIVIALLLVGGILSMASGWETVVAIITGGKNTIEDLGHGKADSAEFNEPTAIINGRLLSFE